MTRPRLRWWFLIVAFVVVAVVSVWRRVDGRKAITDPRAVAVAEDDVYETVVRHLYIPSKKSASAPDVAATQLVSHDVSSRPRPSGCSS